MPLTQGKNGALKIAETGEKKLFTDMYRNLSAHLHRFDLYKL